MNLRDILDCLKEEPGLLIDGLREPNLRPYEFSPGDFTSDSRSVREGSIYFAIRGESVDGHRFIPDVLARGAALIIAEENPTAAANVAIVKNTRLASALLAARAYGEPSKDLLVAGVTGTSGKTTTSYLLESIFRAAGRNVGLIGTVEMRFLGKKIEATHTTPDPWTLQKILADMSDAGCDTVVMEVSSHALKQNRVSGIAFDGALFTNLTPEHLDYHPDLEDYFAAKKLLFTEEFARAERAGKNPVGVVHAGESYGARLANELASGGVTSFIVPPDIEIDAQGIRGAFQNVRVHSPLIAQFNAENIAGAVALAKALKMEDAAISRGIAELAGVPGRLERVPDPRGRIVLVDYAHKPDALQKVLRTLQPMRAPGKRLICVFGCGGDRDPTKRPVMGRIACRLADEVILTSDNPRTEDPAKIIDAIEAGCGDAKNLSREADRSRAIADAIARATPGDIVLIAGKGHEDYQIIGREKRSFDDREVAREALKDS